MKIRSKISAATIATSVVFAISVLSFVVYWVGKDNKEKVQESFSTQNLLLTKEFASFTFERSGDLEIVAEEVKNHIHKNELGDLENLLYSTRNFHKIYQNLFFINKNKIKVLDTNRIKTNEVSNYPFFNSLKNKREVDFEFYYDEDTKQDVLYFALPLHGKKGEFLGVIVANVLTQSISNMTRSYISENANYKKEIEILRADGSIIFSNYRDQKSDSELASFAEQLISKSDKVFFIEKGGFYWSMSSQKLKINVSKSQNIYFVFRALKSEVNKDLNKLYKIIFILFFVSTLLLTLVGWAIARSITKPIDSTTKAIIKAGEGDFEALNSIKVTHDDYGILVSHIQDMTLKLNLSIKEQHKKERMASLGEMAAGIAHEINNPLQLISAQAHVLKRIIKSSEFDREKADKGLLVISETVKRIATIIKGLKSLSRDGAQDPFVEASLDSIFENTFLICSEKFKTHGIFLQVIKPEENILFDCRSVQISQVLLNIVNNACDTIVNEEERWIKIECKKEENSLKLKITNSGTKISKNIADKLFTPFFTTKAEGVGTGLGLSISLAIIHAHKGNISIDLENKNTCFVIELPLVHTKTENSAIVLSA